MNGVTKTYQLDMLNTKSVSVLVKTYIQLEEGAEPQIVGLPVRTSYVNSELGRQQIVEELPEEFYSAILTVWGEEPNVPNPPSPEPVQEEVR